MTDDPKVTVASKHDVLVVWDGSIGKCATGLEGAVGSTIVALKPMGVASGFLEAFIKNVRRTLVETVAAQDYNTSIKRCFGN